jgi:uncharacterized peroxidase-related enzyme
MSWIEEISEDDASGELQRVYAAIGSARGKVSNIMKVHSLNPGAMRQHLGLYAHLMFGASGLTRGEREAIAVAVSQVNGCDYCVNHHREALGAVERTDAVGRGGAKQDRPARRAAMLAYAEKLTTAPHTVNAVDVQGLRAVGLGDRDILDVALIASYFNFVNRIALGLGVEFNPEEVHGYRS